MDEFRNLLGFCEPKSPPIYPGTFIGNEPAKLPEKSPWMSCLAAPHLKRKRSLIRASGLGNYKVRHYEGRFATDEARLFYCLENNSLVVSAAMKSKLEQAEPKLKFALRGKV